MRSLMEVLISVPNTNYGHFDNLILKSVTKYLLSSGGLRFWSSDNGIVMLGDFRSSRNSPGPPSNGLVLLATPWQQATFAGNNGLLNV